MTFIKINYCNNIIYMWDYRARESFFFNYKLYYNINFVVFIAIEDFCTFMFFNALRIVVNIFVLHLYLVLMLYKLRYIFFSLKWSQSSLQKKIY